MTTMSYDKSSSMNYNITADGKSVCTGKYNIPVSFIREYFPRTEIHKSILKLPAPFHIGSVEEKYREWYMGQGEVKIVMARDTQKDEYVEYLLTEDRKFVPLLNTDIPVAFILKSAPGVEISGGVLKLPLPFQMTDIEDKYRELYKRPIKDTNTIESTLKEREKTHGKFCDHAYYTQSLKSSMHEAHNWVYLNCSKKESLEMIAHKIGRILAGDPNLPDHWDDIAGYATLISQELAEQMKIANSMYPGREENK